eukprot:TRINITY_DN9846_c0_g3_i1.p1 TRINITY_DN9846_c0_g3~~TRINITY_DN9846_c0_g3_i1.p1  ORF type:complete len:151 (+),score=10.18 TRINITY_DN9846_c0_g3_i1:63-515(+)
MNMSGRQLQMPVGRPMPRLLPELSPPRGKGFTRVPVGMSLGEPIKPLTPRVESRTSLLSPAVNGDLMGSVRTPREGFVYAPISSPASSPRAHQCTDCEHLQRLAKVVHTLDIRLHSKEADLAMRKKELDAREQRLRDWEAELAARSGGKS